MGHIVGNQVTVVRGLLTVFVGGFENRMTETSVNVVAERISLNDVVAQTQVDGHLGQLIGLRCRLRLQTAHCEDGEEQQNGKEEPLSFH